MVLKISNEQLMEEKANLEQELRRLQLELVDILNINDNLAIQIKDKVMSKIPLKYHA